MGNKDLLFMLENGTEYVKGIYEASEDRIYYLSTDEMDTFENVGMLVNNIVHLYEENRIEYELLIEEIMNDEDLLYKIKKHHSDKLLFRYNNKNFNKLINLI